MKSLAEMNGLKIISIAQGQQVSTVKDIILDPENGCLAFFVIDQPSDYLGARIIAYSDILGLGDYALIIPNIEVIQDVAHCFAATELLKKDIKVHGAQVLSDKGYLMGEITEIIIDEGTGRLAICQVRSPEGIDSEVKFDKVIKFGKDIIILGDTSSETRQVPIAKANVQLLDKPVNEKEILKKRIEEFGKNDNLLKTAELSSSIDYPEDFNVFEQRQLQFLLGKTLNTDVNLDNGQVLGAGQLITMECLSAVKTRNTLMQMTTHVVK